MSKHAQGRVRVVNDLGMHLRAAGALVQVASGFRAEIWLECRGQRINGKSIMSVLSLAAGKGSDLLVTADGADAESAVQAVVALIAGGFAHP